MAATDPADRVGQAAQLVPDPADRVDLAITGPVGLAARVDPVTTGPVGPAARVDLVTTAPVARVDRATTDPVDRAALERGTAMTTAATSTVPRGETGPHPGVQASHHGRPGTGRFPRPVDGGTRARSTTGATTKTRSGTKGSTSGASTFSESGFRCKESPHQTPASPIGGAGVARLAADQLHSICDD